MSKVLKKAAMFTDIHFGKKNNSEEHNQDCLNFIKWFCDQVRADPEIDHIWFLGDWNEHRAAINAFTLQRSFHGAKMLNELGIPVYFIVGNHDLAFRNTRTTYTTEIFEPLENFILLSETKVIEEIYGTVLAIPYLREDEYPTLIEHSKVPVAMGHLELKGFRVSGSSNVMEHGPESSTFFKKQKRVFTGHFHQRQTQGNVHYIGNTFPMDFSDANDNKRGMATYDFVTDKLTYTDWADCPKYIKVGLSDVLEDPKKALVKNARVKVDVDTEITFEESNLIRERLQKKYALREITLEESYSIDVALSEEEEAIEDLQLETTNEVILELLRRIKDSSVDTELLLSIYKKLATSAKEVNAKAANVEFLDMTMENYLAYGNNTTKVNLNFDTPTLIVGRNYDSVVDGQVDSNGAGKSTILNGLLMCMFDKNLMGVDKNAQINKANKKNMLLTCTFRVDGKYYKVERYRKNKLKGGDGVRLYMNADEPVFGEEQDVTPDSVANCNAEIERIIGIPYEMFIRIVVFSATHEPFLSLPSSHASKANQRDIIEELFGLTDLTHKAEKLKELLSASKSEFKNLVEVNARIEAEHGRHEQQIAGNVQRLNDWDNNRESRILELETQLAEMQGIDLQNSIEGFEEAEKLNKELVKAEKNIPTLEAELRNIRSLTEKRDAWETSNAATRASLQVEFDRVMAIDFDDLKKKRSTLVELKAGLVGDWNKQTELNAAIVMVKRNMLELNTNILKKQKEVEHLGDNQCPYCMQQFAEAKVKIAECNHSISQFTDDLNKLTSDLNDKTTELADLDSKVKDINFEIEKLVALVPSNIEAMEANKETVARRLEDAIVAVNPHVISEDDLTEEDILEELNSLKAKADKIRSKLSMATEFIHASFKTMADVQSHQVRMESIKNRIEEMQDEVNPFVSVVDSLQSTKLEGLKTDAINVLDKEIKHQDFLLKLLTKKDSFIRKALLNKSIPLLNSRLRMNLDKVGLPHRVTFTEEMEVSITQFGAEYEYGNFSAGQKARVNLCLAFAFRDVLQSRFGKINLCILDECLDTGLGNVGVTQATKMIKSIAVDNHLSMFVISHRDEVLNMFDKRLEIELRNGFSNILDPA